MSQVIAESVEERCAEAGVFADVRPVDETDQVQLARYPGLVVVLPTLLEPTPTDSLRRIARLIGLYRAHRPHGLRSLLTDRCRWFDAGVVQVVGPRALLGHPVLRYAGERHPVCVRHYTDGPEPRFDVFEPYTVPASGIEPRPSPPGDPAEDGDARCGRVWAYLRAWGVTDIRLVPPLRGCIEECRGHFEDPSLPALWRPVKEINGNRLYFILDRPDYKPDPQGRKTWDENGARVWRHVRQRLQRIEPGLSRPSGRDNKKGAQDDLRDLYLALCVLDDYLKRTPEAEWDSLS